MKKFLAVVAAVCISCAGFALTACDDRVNEISARCFLHGDVMRLPVSFTRAYAGDHGFFLSDDDLYDFKDCVEGIRESGASFSAEVYGENFLFIEKTTSDGEVHYFIVASARGENAYYFTTPVSDLTEKDTGAESFYTFTPFHLFSPNREIKDYFFYNLNAGEEYELAGTAEEIVSFYEKVGIYDVAFDGSEIRVSVKADAEIKYDSFARASFSIVLSDDGRYAKYCLAAE